MTDNDYLTTTEDIDFNPFASESAITSSTSTRNNSPTYSTFASSYDPRPARHHRTGSGSENGSFNRYRGRGHARAQTEFLASSSHSTSHPLRSAAGFTSGFHDTVTRPHLARMLNTGLLVDAPPVASESVTPEEEEGEEKADVFVHEITANDSLPGVALKYGISLAELRRANHLWTTDSIHLRKVLYIPLDKTKPTLHNIGTLRRIPISELSFFPPSSIIKPPSRPALTPARPISNQPTTNQSRYATSPAPHSLSTILTSLPIPPSTRDTIIARLSFDSVSSSYSDRDHDEEGEGHEMDDVRQVRTPRASKTLRKKSSSPPSPTKTRRGFGEEEYVPMPVIRTKQMEPSPEMQLPFGVGGGRRRERLVDVDFDVHGDGSGSSI